MIKNNTTLRVIVLGIEEDKGAINIAVYNAKDSFMKLANITAKILLYA